MNDQRLDYHVGLLRGFLLATNAHQTILHALDVLLTDYRSKAGDVIGSEKLQSICDGKTQDEIFKKLNGLPAEPMLEARMDIPPPGKKPTYFWNAADDATLERMYCIDGKMPKEIAPVLNRTPASISARINNRHLKRAEP